MSTESKENLLTTKLVEALTGYNEKREILSELLKAVENARKEEVQAHLHLQSVISIVKDHGLLKVTS